MHGSTMTRDDEIRSIHFKYEIPEDKVAKLLDSGKRFGEVDRAALTAVLTGKSIDDILAMRVDDPWGRVEIKLGLTPEVYAARYHHHRAQRLHRFYGIDTARAEKLLAQGYPNHWIRLAYLLEQHTGTKVEDILAARKKSEKWKPWAERVLGVSPADFTTWIAETRNPSLKKK